MYITSFFTENGVPKTGLTPTINIYIVSTGVKTVDAAAMTEIAEGFYKYNFSTFTVTSDYAFIADGGAAQPTGERYVIGGSDDSGNIEFIKNIEGGGWKLDSATSQMIFYKDDNSTTVAAFDLYDSDGNSAVSNVYERKRT